MSATTYAKLENNVVVAVNVVTWDFLVEHPERYGDPAMWIECFQDGSNRGYCGVGWIYHPQIDKFESPFVPLVSDGD